MVDLDETKKQDSLHIIATVVKNIPLCDGHYCLTLKNDLLAKRTQPGQFVNLRIHGREDLLLRRPFSVAATRPAQSLLEIVYRVVGQGTRTMTELSRLLFTENSSMTRLVDRMEKAGLVQRRTDPQDRRTLTISITEAGRKQAAAAKKIVQGVNEDIKAHVSPEELEVLKKVLGRLKRSYKREKSGGPHEPGSV